MAGFQGYAPSHDDAVAQENFISDMNLAAWTFLPCTTSLAEAPEPMPPQVTTIAPKASRPPLKTNYQFIEEPANGPIKKNARTTVRRHVMSQHMRQKRWQEKGQLDHSTLLEQKGFKIDTRELSLKRPSRARDRASVIPLEPAANPIAQSVEDDSIEEIQRDMQSVVNPYNWPGLSTTEPSESFQARVLPKMESVFANYGQGISPDSNSLPAVAQNPTSSRSASIDSLLQDYSYPLSLATQRYAQFESTSSPSEEREPETPAELSVMDIKPSPNEEGFDLRFLMGIRSPSPQSLLGQARKDPFNTLPIRLNADEHGLFDHFLTVLPSDYYGAGSRRDFVFNWFRDVLFPVAMKGNLPFRLGVLGYAAIHRARMQGLTTTPELTYHADKAVCLLRNHFTENPNDCSDHAIAVSLIQATFDDFTLGAERKAASWNHMRAAMRMIRTRGGPQAFSHSPRMVMLTNCYDYRISGYQSEGSSFNWSSYPKGSFPDNITPQQLGRQELVAATAQFIQWLRNLEHLALVQRSPSYASLSPRRHKVFLPGTSIHNIIGSPPGARRATAGYQHQQLYGMSVLIHLNAALWDFRRSSDLSERFLKEVCLRIVQNELDTYTSVEAFAQLMLRPSEDPELHPIHIERLWFVGRILKVCKRLSKASWARLRSTLLGFLTFEDVNNTGGSVFMWEDELRQEILDAPATSYVMPALQFAADEL